MAKRQRTTKADLVAGVARSAGLTKAQAQKAVDTVFTMIRDSLKRGTPVTLVGFGAFSVAQRKARRGRNPRTGQSIMIPARKAVRFRPGRQLREAIR